MPTRASPKPNISWSFMHRVQSCISKKWNSYKFYFKYKLLNCLPKCINKLQRKQWSKIQNLANVRIFFFIYIYYQLFNHSIIWLRGSLDFFLGGGGDSYSCRLTICNKCLIILNTIGSCPPAKSHNVTMPLKMWYRIPHPPPPSPVKTSSNIHQTISSLFTLIVSYKLV